MSTDQTLLSASRASAILHVSVKTVTRWCIDGSLPSAEKLAGGRGGRGTWLIAESEVYALAERRRAELLQRLPQPTPPALADAASALAGAGVPVPAQGVA